MKEEQSKKVLFASPSRRTYLQVRWAHRRSQWCNTDRRLRHSAVLPSELYPGVLVFKLELEVDPLASLQLLL